MLAIDYRLRTSPDSVHMILLDEPTAGMNNPAGSRQIFERIAAWRRDFPEKTIIVLNHDESLFAYLSEDTRILGVDSDSGELVQDETLDKARNDESAPFAKLFL